jgi:hypothetical protein
MELFLEILVYKSLQEKNSHYFEKQEQMNGLDFSMKSYQKFHLTKKRLT